MPLDRRARRHILGHLLKSRVVAPSRVLAEAVVKWGAIVQSSCLRLRYPLTSVPDRLQFARVALCRQLGVR